MDDVGDIERGRRAFAARRWTDAYESLSCAAATAPLTAKDLELLATSAYMVGREEAYINALARAYHVHLENGAALPAARCAIGAGLALALRGDTGRGVGWFGRAQRLVEREPGDCAERGYLLLPVMFRHENAGDYGAAAATAADAAAIAERFGDADLFALAVQAHGQYAVLQGRVAEGLALMDEAMVAVTAGELSPIATGLVYCAVILGCQAAYALGRAQEWTAALTQWCEHQPDMVAFTGRCLTHRAEILCLHGAWSDALRDARRARRRSAQAGNRPAGGEAVYLEAEIHRLRGEHAAAEAAYREASRTGREPQPGLALLRLAQGNVEAAAAAIRRALSETTEPPQRGRLLPAYVEIMLAHGDADAAHSACAELLRVAEVHESPMLHAMAAYAAGSVALAAGDARAALVALRRAVRHWQQLDAPYEAGRARALVGVACRTLGDDETARLELEAARDAFAALGAAPDVAGVGPSAAHGLTPRELQVLRLVAAGKSNRQIAAELMLSEHTVARHLQNIFAKLGVASRTAAAAFAFSHDLV